MEKSEEKDNFLDTVAHKKAFKNKSKKDNDSIILDASNSGKKEEKADQKLKNGLKEKIKKAFHRDNFRFIEHSKKKPFSIHGVLVIWLLMPFFLFGTLSYLYEYHNKDKVYSGVRVLGIDAGGKSKDELSKIIDGQVTTYKLKIEGENQSFEAGLGDLGIAYDKEKIAADAYEYGRNDSVLNNFLNRTKRYLSRFEVNLGSSPISLKKHDVEPTYNIDDIKLDKYLADVEAKININPKDSQVTTQGASMQIVPAVFGRKLKTAELKTQIVQATTNFESAPLKIQAETLAPVILDDKTRILAEDADKIASKSVILIFKDKKYTPTKDVVVSWITFTRENDKADWKMVVDPSKMSPYFKTIAKDINIYAVDKKVRVENGVKEVVTQEGSNGTVINEASLSSQIATTIQKDPQVSLTIPMMTVAFKTKKENIVVANWDKYIDVNLSAQKLVAYEKGGVVKGSWTVATGKAGYATPVGTWLVIGKSSWIRMKGMEGTSEYYNVYPVKWVTWFKGGGYAMHDAYWRNGSFGYPASHGCINIPDAGASFIYSWADTGTPVIIHY